LRCAAIPLFARDSVFYMALTPTETYTLSLHDALPISDPHPRGTVSGHAAEDQVLPCRLRAEAQDVLRLRRKPFRELQRERPRNGDRKSTRLNSSHVSISYAVFCLKKKKIYTPTSGSRR